MIHKDIRAALIDMDGVLYDSMPGHADAWHQLFTELGIRTERNEFFLYEGMTGSDTINLIFKRELGRPATEDEKRDYYARKAEIFNSFGEKKDMEGALGMLEKIKSLGLKTILVTGSAQGSLLGRLQQDYPDFFPEERRVTARDVMNGKPDPEPYLKGADKAGIEPSRCIVIENAPLGVRAAKAAGCLTIAVMTGPIPREEFEKEEADLIFSSMKDLDRFLQQEIDLREETRQIDLFLNKIIDNHSEHQTFIVTDRNVVKYVWPLLKDTWLKDSSGIIVLEPGEENKNIDAVFKIWNELEKHGATRNTLLINLGGGIVTDIGGFAAATFKRGIPYINIPTTLLGAVDAATGGKTGVNFNGLKNEIGAFYKPEEVFISSLPLSTLPRIEILAGYAEMLKTALIADAGFYESIYDLERICNDPGLLQKAMKECIKIKEEIVATDPREKGLRKVLNFGHTVAHAFESFFFIKSKSTKESPMKVFSLEELHEVAAFTKPYIPKRFKKAKKEQRQSTGNIEGLPHGIAVAHGLLVELILSNMVMGLPIEAAESYSRLLKTYYPRLSLTPDSFPEICNLMARDKKNTITGRPNFTLLQAIGEPVINCHPGDGEILEALNTYLAMC